MNIENWKSEGPDTMLMGKQRDEFLRLYQRFLAEKTKLEWGRIQSPPASRLADYQTLAEPSKNTATENYSRLVVCKLNGGLGTTMGCGQTKSLLEVREGKSFLDLIFDQLKTVNQKFCADIPLLLMNSFYTDLETRSVLKNYSGKVRWQTFLQNKFPRLHADTGNPLSEDEYGEEACYPPGHGDLFFCLEEQGIWDSLVSEGRDILFVSNSDNLGALPDDKILNHIVENNIPFLIEMTPKTIADVKGGTLYVDNDRLNLLEIGAVPEEHLSEFCSQQKFKIFNTNNIWINLVALREQMVRGGFDLEVIGNRKMVGDTPIIQLETALGSAINRIEGACGIVVPRDRFLPVKKTSDLLLLRSDLFIFKNGVPEKNPIRKLEGLPEIRLGAQFDSLEDFQARIPIPLNIIDLRSLVIEGDVRFEGECTLTEDVEVIADQKAIVIPNKAVI
ncbi:MAG: hypothetical protein COV66_06600 [Nitrospinae bacterium CG11_big_fil_rev_8_21_14_0_20_45_15]|nr:MAG: hypothetical protein COV66_06600 [Nitrospinae bacterium CG11_big_fil_rev_8_21_14_0_20_45_15]